MITLDYAGKISSFRHSFFQRSIGSLILLLGFGDSPGWPTERGEVFMSSPMQIIKK